MPKNSEIIHGKNEMKERKCHLRWVEFTSCCTTSSKDREVKLSKEIVRKLYNAAMLGKANFYVDDHIQVGMSYRSCHIQQITVTDSMRNQKRYGHIWNFHKIRKPRGKYGNG